jgi:hypothetical protein
MVSGREIWVRKDDNQEKILTLRTAKRFLKPISAYPPHQNVSDKQHTG